MQITWARKPTLRSLSPGQAFIFEGHIYIKLQFADELEMKALEQAGILESQTSCYVMSPETGLIFNQRMDMRVRPVTTELTVMDDYNPMEE